MDLLLAYDTVLESARYTLADADATQAYLDKLKEAVDIVSNDVEGCKALLDLEFSIEMGMEREEELW